MKNEDSPISWRQLLLIVPIVLFIFSIAGGYFTLYGQIALIQQRLDTIISSSTGVADRIEKNQIQLQDHEIRLDRLERAAP